MKREIIPSFNLYLAARFSKIELAEKSRICHGLRGSLMDCQRLLYGVMLFMFANYGVSMSRDVGGESVANVEAFSSSLIAILSSTFLYSSRI